MKQTKIKDGIKVYRIGSKHAFYSVVRDEYETPHIIMYSYNTPIFIVSRIGNDKEYRLSVTLNKDCYNYSRTTSKQVGQWISYLHLFTTFCAWLPYSFRSVLKYGTDDKTAKHVSYYIVNERELRDIVRLYAGNQTCELRDLR